MTQASQTARLKPGEDGEHPTFCRLCEAFCGLTARVEHGRIVDIGADRANPLSQGHLCVKGVAMKEIVYDPDRVTRPLKRTGGPGEFTPVSWDEALDDIAQRLSAVLSEDGPNAFALYLGNPAAFSTDTLMASQWILKRIGSKKFYTAGTQDTASRHFADHLLYGIPFRGCLPDLPNCDFLIVAGSNLLVTHGGHLTAPGVRHDLDAIAARGRVIVIDPRHTETAKRYEYIPIRPDTDVWLFSAMLRVLREEGLCDEAFLSAHTEGAEQLLSAVSDVSLEEAEERTGIPSETIRTLARDFAKTERAAIYSRVGICRGTFPTLANVLLDALNICAGKFGKRGGWTFCPYPFRNGSMSFPSANEERSRIGDLPMPCGMVPGVVFPDDILEPGEGRVRVVLLVAGNPVLSAPGGARLEEALSALDLLISTDIYVTESNRYAHYILPSRTFFEKDDVPLLGLARMPRPFIQYTEPVIAPVGEARGEFDVFSDLARRMGMGPIHPSPMMRMLARIGLNPRPLNLIDLGLRLGPLGDWFGFRKGLSLKTLSRRHPHGVMLNRGLAYDDDWKANIIYPDGRIRLWVPVIEEEFARFREARAREPDARLKLFGRRLLKSLNSWMHNVDRLVRTEEPSLLIHPDDAAVLGVESGDIVSMQSDWGAVEVAVEVSREVIAGSVCYPHGFGHDGGWRRANALPGANVNHLLPHGPNGAEKVSGMTFMDGLPVAITLVERSRSVTL